MTIALEEEHELGDIVNLNMSQKPSKSGLESSRSESAATNNGVVESDLSLRDEIATIEAAYTSTSVSPEERKVQIKAELKGFCTLLLFIFLEGWNDGTLGL